MAHNGRIKHTVRHCFRKLSRCLLYLFLIGGAAGCAALPQDAGPGRTARAETVIPPAADEWWNQYYRGLAFAEAGRLGEAFAEFSKAADQREQDQWQAATGDQSHTDYFPQREMGIIYLQRREYDKAIERLEHSLASAPSARAGYFLDRARTEKISSSQRNTAPQLHLETSTALEVTNNPEKIIRGVARADSFIASIQVNEYSIPLESSVKQKIFTLAVPLHEGENSISVTATDLAGRSTRENLNIYCDLQGPVIEIESLQVNDERIFFKGKVFDDKALASLTVNDRSWPITGSKPAYSFSFSLPDGPITLRAEDKAGNVTLAAVRREEIVHLLSASPDQNPAAAGHGGPKAAAGNPPALDVPAQQAPADHQPPFIHINGFAADRETYNDHVIFDTMIHDSSNLIYISINGREILNGQVKRVYFSLLQPLKPGPNTIAVTAADEHGNTAYKNLTVTRLVPGLLQPESRMTLAILPFAARENSAGQLAASFRKTGRFSVVKSEEVAAVMSAFRADEHVQFTKGQAAEIGRAVGADAVLFGMIRRFPGSREIFGRIIATDSTALLAQKDAFLPDPGPDEKTVPDRLFYRFAEKFLDDLPLVSGLVTGVENGEIIINIGRDKKITPGIRLLCYRTPPPVIHPVTGIAGESEPRVLAVLEVIQVTDTTSRAVAMNPQAGIIVSDQVIVL